MENISYCFILIKLKNRKNNITFVIYLPYLSQISMAIVLEVGLVFLESDDVIGDLSQFGSILP